jgi:hypothetical protein
MRVLSLGAGVQSSTLLLMAIRGEIAIDRAIFADTGWEPRGVYDWLGGLELAAGHAGIPVDIVTAGDLRDDALAASRRFASMPLHVVNADGRPGMLRRQCTKEYKVRPIQRRLRELGAGRGTPATLLVGISLDEAMRMKPSRVQYVRHEYPLVDRRLTRHDCVTWLDRHGYSEPPKSACIGCPFIDNRRWREMRDQRPDEWADAVAFDADVRRMSRIEGDVFLHRSLRPLPMVDLSTARDAGQLGLFDAECEGMCGV